MFAKEIAKINRLAIFIFYDKQGIVDDYVPYFLNELKPFIEDLVIVANGEINSIGQKKLKSIATNIFVRENIGYEPGAIKDVLFKFYGFEKILKYDEILICNDTFYGPFFDLKEIFCKMNKIDCDFWGITEQAAKRGSYPKHIQSYFYNIKKNLLHSKSFRFFFENLSLPKNLNQAIKSYEIAMSQFFLKAGFSYASFVDINNFIEKNVSKNYNYSLTSPMSLLTKKCPFIKKKAFFFINEETFMQGGEQSCELMRFIENNTRYPKKIIWQNLLRIASIAKIKNKLHLQYVLPKNTLLQNTVKSKYKKTVVVAHLFYADLLHECLAYLGNVPKFIDLIVMTSKTEIAKKVQNHFVKKRKCEIRIIKNREINIKDILQKYDYLCYTHDKKKDREPTEIEANSFRFLFWECTLASECYIKNILNKFESEPELGFLNVPQPFHGGYSSAFMDSTFATGTAFWCKTKSLTALFKHKNRKINQGIERLFPNMAQSTGYYSGICLTDSYAQVRINCLEYIVRNKEEEKKIGKEIFLFAQRYSIIYIYGTGIWSRKVTKILNYFEIKYEGFIVSKKQKFTFLRKPILELDEVVLNKNTGIILGLDKPNSSEVLLILRKRKVDRNCILRINS
jgi:rhamnosyltransferase